jgi:transposase
VPDLTGLGLAAQKKSLHDSQQETPRVKRLRHQFARRVARGLGARLNRWKVIDESGVHLGLTRLYGRAGRGARVCEATPGRSGRHYTVVAALGWRSVHAPWVVEGAMDGVAFEIYMEKVLLPTLRAGDIVLMDNLSVHKGPTVRRLLEARGVRLEFLPPYSPDLNPIEQCWSKVKTALRAAKARTLEALLAALARALEAVTRDDIRAWFAHCGYTFS